MDAESTNEEVTDDVEDGKDEENDHLSKSVFKVDIWSAGIVL